MTNAQALNVELSYLASLYIDSEATDSERLEILRRSVFPALDGPLGQGLREEFKIKIWNRHLAKARS